MAGGRMNVPTLCVGLGLGFTSTLGVTAYEGRTALTISLSWSEASGWIGAARLAALGFESGYRVSST